jgi:hypothetical protein
MPPHFYASYGTIYLCLILLAPDIKLLLPSSRVLANPGTLLPENILLPYLHEIRHEFLAPRSRQPSDL